MAFDPSDAHFKALVDKICHVEMIDSDVD